MYNRYIPQSDGSYRRNTVGEQHIPPSPPSTQPPPQPPQIPEPPPPQIQGSPLHFLRNLLPKNFDTADLLIVLLLLLMSGEDGEMQNNGILTLALYLFL